MAKDDSSSLGSPEISPPLDTSSSPPLPSDSSSSPPPPNASSSSTPPTSDSDNSEGSLSSPPPPDNSPGSSLSPPSPSLTEGSQSSPPPPTESVGKNSGNEGGSKSSPPPIVEVWAPLGIGQKTPTNGTLGSSGQGSRTLSPPFSKSSNNSTANIVGIVGICGILILMLIACVLCVRKKKRAGAQMPLYGWKTGPNPQGNQYWNSTPQGAHDHIVKIPQPLDAWGLTTGGHENSGPYSGSKMTSSLEPSPSLTLGFNKSTFSYEELAAATNNFDNSKMLGQGGFGYVHKGVLPNGKEIAVKSLKSGSGQGEREFAAEVEIISRVHHRHLVSLVGFCIASGQRMLVYEFVPNDTLEYHLHKKGDLTLDFSTRLRVALGSAKGLGYLHEDCHPRIIHRDIKASNILLDEKFEAMVADFGLAKLTSDANTHVSTRVMGTFGYLAPEYASSGKLTEKSDVFSFGVMLLELITGRRPVDPNMQYMEDSLVDWSRPLLAKALEIGKYDELVDPRLERKYNHQEMKRMIACAAASIQHSAKRRPKMSQIVRALEGDVSLDDLNNDGTKGAKQSLSEETSSDYDSRAYSADLKKFRQIAFETEGFSSSEYGRTTNK